MRSPAATGFYPADKEILYGKIRMLLEDAKSIDIKDAVAAIVPHAGYSFSGPTAANAYTALSNGYGTIILLGTNHTGIGASIAVSLENWLTPLGVAENDSEMGKKIVAFSKNAAHDESAHKREHSIEVQLPFLQATMQKFKIVPVAVSSGLSVEKYLELAKAIEKAVSGKKVLVIASSDFTHYGAMYGFAPACEDANKWVHETDMKVINAILSGDVKKFLKLAGKTTVCGNGAIATLMYYAHGLKGTLVDYRTSFDVSGDEDIIVGYAGILF